MAHKERSKVRGVYEQPPGSGVWWIQYFEHGRRHREKIGPRALAIAVREKRRTEIREGRYFPNLRRRAVLFEDLLAEYREAKRREGKEVQRGEYGYLRLLDAFGGRRADAVTARDVEAFRDQLQETLAPASVVRHLTLLRAIFNRAVRDGLISSLPTRNVRWPKENNKRVRCLSEDEEARLMNVLPERLGPLVTVALNTGMRRGELIALRWKDIDLVNCTVAIRRAKSGEGRRLPINEQAHEVLSKMRRERIREGGAGGDVVAFREAVVFGPSAAAMVMALKRHFGRALREAEIEDFHFHDLRHTAASRLAMAGVDLYTIGELLGHKTLTMTRRYAHLLPDHLKRAVAMLDNRTRGSAGGTFGGRL
jgi:integrase